jgi:hypothetical protein
MKPVAWIDYLEDSNVYDLNVSGRGVPLYTAPRELSDEEIYEVWSTLPYDDQCPFDGRATYRFARAILKKASEK